MKISTEYYRYLPGFAPRTLVYIVELKGNRFSCVFIFSQSKLSLFHLHFYRVKTIC